jgi:Ser/Thr protein kinase RdoA (MazF antagonist)/predicted DNA-binding protein (MmcQ/YjbR family)
MTRDASFKKVVRRHAEETGQRYTEALTDLEGLGARMDHEPVPERLLAHLRDQYRIDPVAATKLSVHKTYVFRIDRSDGEPWVARAFPPARPRTGVEGDAAILRFLERQDYPAERPAVDDPVSDFDGGAVLVTRFLEGVELPNGEEKFAMIGELLGRLHALPYDESASRPGGASGEDPSREGAPCQDLLAALSFLDAVDTKVAAAERERFERLRDKVRSADDGHGLPEALLHGNLLHAPDHAILSQQVPVAINWKASGRGPRLADFAYLIWGTGSWNPRRPNQECIDAAVNAYRQHVEPTDDELDRLEAVMYIRTLYLVCFGYRRAVAGGVRFREWGFIHPSEYYSSTAALVRTAFRRGSSVRQGHDGGSSAARGMSHSRESAPVEVPEDIEARVRKLCMALPEVTVRVDESRTRARSTAHSFDIRRRSFCLLVAAEDSTGRPVPRLVLRADPDDREALVSIGHPFFASRAGRDRIGVLLTDDTDWEEIRELVTESYRLLAPKKLTARLDSQR